MYTQTRTVKSPEFDTVVKFDTVETTSTSSGWKIVGVLDVDVIPKSYNITGFSYTYRYYDNYQGCEITINYNVLVANVSTMGTRKVKVHI